MDHNRFDDLTRTLATSTSRRQALKLFGGGLLAALVPGSALAKGGGNSACAAFCAKTQANARAMPPRARACAISAGQNLMVRAVCVVPRALAPPNPATAPAPVVPNSAMAPAFRMTSAAPSPPSLRQLS